MRYLIWPPLAPSSVHTTAMRDPSDEAATSGLYWDTASDPLLPKEAVCGESMVVDAVSNQVMMALRQSVDLRPSGDHHVNDLAIEFAARVWHTTRH
jgi:hypothetical protein